MKLCSSGVLWPDVYLNVCRTSCSNSCSIGLFGVVNQANILSKRNKMIVGFWHRRRDRHTFTSLDHLPKLALSTYKLFVVPRNWNQGLAFAQQERALRHMSLPGQAHFQEALVHAFALIHTHVHLNMTRILRHISDCQQCACVGASVVPVRRPELMYLHVQDVHAIVVQRCLLQGLLTRARAVAICCCKQLCMFCVFV